MTRGASPAFLKLGKDRNDLDDGMIGSEKFRGICGGSSFAVL